MARNLEALGPPPFTEADRAYAAKMQATMSDEDIAATYASHGIAEAARKPLADFIVPADAAVVSLAGSTDVADVSWVVPTVQLWGATQTIGTPFHTWQMVAHGKSEVAKKGMFHAAAAMAATGMDAFLDGDLRERAKADLAARTRKTGYVCPLPDTAKPPIAAMG